STPNYQMALAAPTVTTLPGGGKVFAGDREDPFFVDLGSIFDLLALRPIQSNHVIHPPDNAPGVDGLAGYNVHVIALQVPIASVLEPGASAACTTASSTQNDKSCVVGVYAAASRQR